VASAIAKVVHLECQPRLRCGSNRRELIIDSERKKSNGPSKASHRVQTQAFYSLDGQKKPSAGV
jgi:hypothetical protein